MNRYIYAISLFFWACNDEVQVSNLSTIQLVATEYILMPNQTTFFYARGFDRDGNRIDKIDVEWSSSNPTIASISNEGKVKALSHGIATISAVSNGISASKELAITSTRRKILSEMFTSST